MLLRESEATQGSNKLFVGQPIWEGENRQALLRDHMHRGLFVTETVQTLCNTSKGGGGGIVFGNS